MESFIDLHRFEGAGRAPTADILGLLELLHGAVTVPSGDSLDFALALDWYNKIVDGRIGPHTELADLVHRGKYWYKGASDAEKLKKVGWAVVDELAGFIGQHPVLRSVDAIAAAPGHDAKVVSFGARVAAGVSIRRGIPLVRCGSHQEFRTPAKSLEPAARAGALGGQFACAEDVYGQRVLIVDDVHGTGATAEETARALRTAGASQVMSLSAVRTMKFL
ncbi:phosphoribosyltransferase family protein [Mycobacterium sp. 236(2023)]|uniref:ComF family protein n=1 Tax=Mycobacterium sp. 236(2023) TaxID=3038163 RepID=UPI002415862F|nr:phosphoribosyltransferase family protein [Mycobacterium sp. 236(2023)]MDG4667339.1 phosphoribosyltransferase family protein [Mycobacterium sp. 236(2023)]